MPTISVVVPCYNGGRFLDQLTASLAAQTFRDFEIVIVDDGSTDPATQAKLAVLDPGIRVIHQDNRGPSAARNVGFSQARADLVMVLDCDDVLEPSYLVETLSVLQSASPEVGFVFTHESLMGARRGMNTKYFNPFDQLFENRIGYSMLIRKAAWRKAGGYDESMIDGCEDWEFSLRLISAGFIGIEIPKPLLRYNVSEQGFQLSRASRLHGRLWRQIRKKHRDLYRLPNLIRLFREERTPRCEISAFRAVVTLLLSIVLPDAWYSAFVHRVRSVRLARAKKAAALMGSGQRRPDAGTEPMTVNTTTFAAQSPAVSIVVPCYNGGRFLDTLMASLARQTFQDFETIIVDDGSTDAATLRKLAALEDYVQVIHQDNRGLPGARNTGIRAARAELVLPLDCDDTIEPPFLEEAVALMRAASPEVAAVFSHMRLTGAANGLLDRYFNRFDLLFTNTMPSGLLLRKASWQAVGGYDELMRDGYEDWEFHLRLARAGYRAIELPKPYYVYYMAFDGMLIDRSSRMHARLWRAIRRKHPDLYRLPAILRTWRETRDGTGKVSLGKALAALSMTATLPDALFNRVVGSLRRRHLLEKHRPAYTGSGTPHQPALLCKK